MKRHASLGALTFAICAEGYDVALERGLAISGESKEYFARERVRWLGGRLRQRSFSPRTILDFGCGSGTATPYLLSLLGAQHVVGVDTSAPLLEIARRTWGALSAEFELLESTRRGVLAELAFCNGVFHHVAPPARGEALAYIHEALETGGYFAFWENNPWSPAARYVMSRIPFDRGAQLISPPAARRLLEQSGFEILGTDWLFIFPRALRALRPLEARAARLPLGAQYLILCRKTARASQG